MKKAINIVVCLATILTLSSCDFFSEKQPVQDSVDSAAPVEGISQEIKNKIAAQDTLMNALVLKVDTLAQALSQAQKENAELKVQVAKLESPKSTWGYMTLASLVIAIIALVLSLLRKGISREKVDEIFSCNLDKSKRIAELKVAVSQLQSGLNSNRASLSVNTSLQNLDARLRSVESYVSRLSSKTKLKIVQIHQLLIVKNNCVKQKILNISEWDTQILIVVISSRKYSILPKKVVSSLLSLRVRIKENLTSFHWTRLNQETCGRK